MADIELSPCPPAPRHPHPPSQVHPDQLSRWSMADIERSVPLRLVGLAVMANPLRPDSAQVCVGREKVWGGRKCGSSAKARDFTLNTYLDKVCH